MNGITTKQKRHQERKAKQKERAKRKAKVYKSKVLARRRQMDRARRARQRREHTCAGSMCSSSAGLSGRRYHSLHLRHP